MQIKYPDYNNSILNLACSVLKHYGAAYTHSTLPYVDKILAKKHKNVAVMVVDGMGIEILEQNLPEDSFLRKHLVKEMTSVFPPTTTAATTTLESGLSPMEHGWLGWSLYFNEIKENINIFLNTNGKGESVTDYHVANRYIPYKNIIDKINETGNAKGYSVSPFGTYHVDSLDELCEGVKTLCSNGENNYIYVYWPEPDKCMHMTGCYSEESKKVLVEINDKVEALCKELKDTLLIITADHGHIDGDLKVILDYPEILSTLKYLPSIEARALSFFVKKGMGEAFKRAFTKYFHNDFLLLSKEEVLKQKIFGSGIPHPKFEDFIGDYMAIGISEVAIFNTREEGNRFIGVHAGLTEREMRVPLIIVES